MDSGIYSGKSSVNLVGMDGVSVAEFIHHSGIWNEEKLHISFPAFEVEKILNIPINPNGSNDMRFWKWDNRGKYLVKSGYHVEMGSFGPHPFRSNYSLQSWWKYIWSLRISPKVKIFIWKAVFNHIPTEVELAYHHVPT